MPLSSGEPSNTLVATFPKATRLSHLDLSIESVVDGFFALALVPPNMNPDDLNFPLDFHVPAESFKGPSLLVWIGVFGPRTRTATAVGPWDVDLEGKLYAYVYVPTQVDDSFLFGSVALNESY
jgi:hypothetical protein